MRRRFLPLEMRTCDVNGGGHAFMSISMCSYCGQGTGLESPYSALRGYTMRLGESAIPRYQIYSPSYGCCVEKRPNPDEHSVVAFGDSCIQLWSLSTVSLIATTLTVQTSAKWSTERQVTSPKFLFPEEVRAHGPMTGLQ